MQIHLTRKLRCVITSLRLQIDFLQEKKLYIFSLPEIFFDGIEILFHPLLRGTHLSSSIIKEINFLTHTCIAYIPSQYLKRGIHRKE